MSQVKLFHGKFLYQARIKATMNLDAHLIPTRHAIEESINEKYGSFTIPRHLPQSFEIVEIEQTNGVTTKIVVRYPLTNDLDIAMVLRQGRKPNSYRVITSWLNECQDQKENIDMSRYSDYREVVY